jgi:hypothetical protein
VDGPRLLVPVEMQVQLVEDVQSGGLHSRATYREYVASRGAVKVAGYEATVARAPAARTASDKVAMSYAP